MTATPDDRRREVLPRWRQWGSARRSGELDPLKSANRGTPADALAEQELAFTEAPGLYTAGDLLSAAAVMNLSGPTVRRAAEFVLHQPARPRAVHELAEHAITNWSIKPRVEEEPPQLDIEAIRGRVARLREILRREPRNSIRWADLARAQAALGAADSAHRSMIIALKVGPINRFLLRAATRLHVYRDDPDLALFLLNRDQRFLADPWVLAAEIATSSSIERTSKNIRRARKMVEDQNITPWHVSELASALSAVELRSGRIKQARKLMSLSLVKPTENSLAQAEWSTSHGLALPPAEEERRELLGVPMGYEARARYFENHGDFKKATENAMLWLADQPFALDAAFFASHTASVMSNDYETAAKASDIGLRTYPNLGGLLNNLAFAYARSNRLKEAAKTLDRLKDNGPLDAQSAVVTATRGLLAFRLGQFEKGRELYQNAVDALLTFRRSETAALAALYWAEEEYLARSPENLHRAIKIATDLVKQTPTPAAKQRVSYLLELLGPATQGNVHVFRHSKDGDGGLTRLQDGPQ